MHHIGFGYALKVQKISENFDSEINTEIDTNEV